MFETLQNVLQSGQTLRLECRRCGHTAVWTREQAIDAFGWHAGPYDVRRAAYCGVCGEREKIAVSI